VTAFVEKFLTKKKSKGKELGNFIKVGGVFIVRGFGNFIWVYGVFCKSMRFFMAE
jgi:hypothetical protein